MNDQMDGPAEFWREPLGGSPQAGAGVPAVHVDAAGRPVDAYGRLLDAYGRPVDAYGRPLEAPAATAPQTPAPAPRRSAVRSAGILVGAALAGGALTVGGLMGLRALDHATGSRIGPPNQASAATPALTGGTSGTAGQPTASPSTDQAGPQAGGSGTATASGSTQKTVTAAQSRGVVLISATLTNGVSAGSGMVIDPAGLVLTNYHVVQGSTALKVTIASTGTSYPATVVGHDATHDVALLRLQGASGLDAVVLDEDPVAAGDRVTAVGNAQGQGYLTAASGSMTRTGSSITVTTDSPGGTETLDDVYETNAGAQPGDSGGPMFDAENEVLGMTTAGEQVAAGGRRGGSSSRTVASYAIPIDQAMAIVKQIEAGDASGTVVVGAKAYLGVMVDASGGDPIVTSVTPGTPAAKAGIEKGSQLTSIAGTAVSTQAEIAAALGRQRAGDAIKVAWTDASGERRSATVVLAASPIN